MVIVGIGLNIGYRMGAVWRMDLGKGETGSRDSGWAVVV